jgi:hypothetical protein
VVKLVAKTNEKAPISATRKTKVGLDSVMQPRASDEHPRNIFGTSAHFAAHPSFELHDNNNDSPNNSPDHRYTRDRSGDIHLNRG